MNDSGKLTCLNPFENQVYFHYQDGIFYTVADNRVLIPLRIRSISTRKLARRLSLAAVRQFVVLIPLRIRSISTSLRIAPYRPVLVWSLNPFENQVYFHS